MFCCTINLTYIKEILNSMANPSSRILIVVSDQKTMRMIGQTSLKKAGYEVLFCNTIDDALEQAVPFLPHIVILDHDLPGLSGRDLMVALHAAAIKSPVVEMMTDDDASNIVQSYRMGARDVLLKPYTVGALVDIVG